MPATSTIAADVKFEREKEKGSEKEQGTVCRPLVRAVLNRERTNALFAARE